MSMIEMFLKELDVEAQTTRKMLAIVPEDKYDWRPHPKSMSIRQLATHIAELPTWITYAVTTDELDFAKEAYDPKKVNTNTDMLAYYEESLADGRAHLEKADESRFGEIWTLRNGDEIYAQNTKAETIRVAYSQTVHHRAQLGVFLRLLDIPIPGSYGPSADEMPLK
jgi:uncharacterized damage-inducible protein DinB